MLIVIPGEPRFLRGAGRGSSCRKHELLLHDMDSLPLALRPHCSAGNDNFKIKAVLYGFARVL